MPIKPASDDDRDDVVCSREAAVLMGSTSLLPQNDRSARQDCETATDSGHQALLPAISRQRHRNLNLCVASTDRLQPKPEAKARLLFKSSFRTQIDCCRADPAYCNCLDKRQINDSLENYKTGEDRKSVLLCAADILANTLPFIFRLLAGSTMLFLVCDGVATKGFGTTVVRKRSTTIASHEMRGRTESSKQLYYERGSRSFTADSTIRNISAALGSTLVSQGSRSPPTFNSNRASLPRWFTQLPRTQFTSHVLEVVANLTEERICPEHYNLTVSASNTNPVVECNPISRGDYVWCGTLKRIFNSSHYHHRVLPYNVSIGFALGDYFHPEELQNSCVGSSSPGGRLCMPNMQQLEKMLQAESALYHGQPERYRLGYKDDVPWEERDSIPVFRGTAWSQRGRSCTNDIANSTYQQFLALQAARFGAVDFSTDHPYLLNARFSHFDSTFDECLAANATNGLSKLLPAHRIGKGAYYSNYQVALVLKGIGAAFRLAIHLMTRTAVVLEECEMKEWFTPYMQPFVHYIPLSSDLSNLHETLEWVKNHPEKVKAIGENGRSFYEEYLSFFDNDEHIYELVYRLAEYRHFH